MIEIVPVICPICKIPFIPLTQDCPKCGNTIPDELFEKARKKKDE